MMLLEQPVPLPTTLLPLPVHPPVVASVVTAGAVEVVSACEEEEVVEGVGVSEEVGAVVHLGEG